MSFVVVVARELKAAYESHVTGVTSAILHLQQECSGRASR